MHGIFQVTIGLNLAHSTLSVACPHFWSTASRILAKSMQVREENQTMSKTSEFPIDVLEIQFHFGNAKSFWTWFRSCFGPVQKVLANQK